MQVCFCFGVLSIVKLHIFYLNIQANKLYDYEKLRKMSEEYFQEQEDFLNHNIRDPNKSDGKVECDERITEDLPIDYLNFELGRKSFYELIHLIKENWNPFTVPARLYCKRWIVTLNLPISIITLIVNVSLIDDFFQPELSNRTIVIGFNDTAIRNRSVSGFTTKECIELPMNNSFIDHLPQEYMSYSCWKVHHWFGLLSIISLYNPATNKISAILGPGTTSILALIWSFLVMIAGIIMMTLVMTISSGGKWFSLFLLSFGGISFFLDVIFSAKIYSTMRKLYQSDSMKETISLYLYGISQVKNHANDEGCLNTSTDEDEKIMNGSKVDLTIKFISYPFLFFLSPLLFIYINFIACIKQETSKITANQRKMCIFARSIFALTPLYCFQLFKIMNNPKKFFTHQNFETLYENLTTYVYLFTYGWYAIVSPLIEKYWNRDFFNIWDNFKIQSIILILNTMFKIWSISIITLFFNIWTIFIIMASFWTVLCFILILTQWILHSRDIWEKQKEKLVNRRQREKDETCWQRLAGTRIDGIILSFITQTNLENNSKAKTTRLIVFYYTLVMYTLGLGSILCVCHTDPEYVQILGPNISWSEFKMVHDKSYLHLALGIAFGLGFSSLVLDLFCTCGWRNSVYHSAYVEDSTEEDEDESRLEQEDESKV